MRLEPCYSLLWVALAFAACGDDEGDTSSSSSGSGSGSGGSVSSGTAMASSGSGTGGSTGTMCADASECRLFESYCSTNPCECVPLHATDPDPPCDDDETITCLVPPCEGLSAACNNGACSAGNL